jgi:hypothetical protein
MTLPPLGLPSTIRFIQYGSYTTQMIKGVIAGMRKASMDHDAVAIIFTSVGDRAFTTEGNGFCRTTLKSQRLVSYFLVRLR